METNVKYAVSQTYMVDGVEIHIYHNPFTKQQYVRLVGGGYAAYEFFTTDAFVYDPFPGTPPHNIATDAYTCGHLTQLRLGPTLQPRKVGSYTGLDGAQLVSYLDGAHGALLDTAFNDQKLEFRQGWTVGTEPQPLPVVPDPELMTLSVTCSYDARAPYYLQHQQTIGSAAHLIGDVGWDVRQTVFQKHKKLVSATPLLSAPKWWRRGTTLKTSGGLVGVVTDSFNNFYFFKISDVSTDPTLTVKATTGEVSYIPLDKCIVVCQDAYMPAWVSRCTDESLAAFPASLQGEGNNYAMKPFAVAPPSFYPDPGVPRDAWGSSAPQSAVYQTNQSLWNFSSDGRKAVAIVGYDRGLQQWQPLRYVETNDRPQWQPLEPVVTAQYSSDSVYDVRIPAELAPQFSTALGLRQRHVITPALLELNITAQIDEGGVLTATVGVRSYDREAWYVNADYVYRHPDLAAIGVHEGDLVTGEVRCYTHNSLAPVSDVYLPESVDVISTYRVRKGSTTLLEVATGITAPSGSPYDGVPVSSIAIPTVTKCTPYGNCFQVYAYGGVNKTGPNTFEVCAIKDNGGGNYSYTCSNPFVGSIPTYVGNPVVPPVFSAVVSACDLRSLSFVFSTWSYNTKETRGLVVYKRGVVDYSSTDALMYTSFSASEWVDANVLKVYPTSAEIELYAPRVLLGNVDGRVTESMRMIGVDNYTVAHTALGPWNGAALAHLSTHPNGSFAACVDSDGIFGVYDKIEYSYVKNGVLHTSLSTHADMFNKAFHQTRQHSDYGSATATFEYGSFGFSGGWV
jgi:hypothetical protein